MAVKHPIFFYDNCDVYWVGFSCTFDAGVFYCGAHGLVGELKRLAQDFSRKTETKFDFHKENF